MEFERKDPDCKFTIPDVITVRQQLAYFSSYPNTGSNEWFARKWEAAKALITKWECPLFPDLEASLDSVSDPNVSLLLVWAGSLVKDYIDGLKRVPKN